jgi:DNA-binding CsgD family transcriptional regulator
MQTLVSAADFRGNFVAISNMSIAAKKGGLKEHQALGHPLWDFNPDPKHVETIRTAFAKCVIDQERQDYEISSAIGGRYEHWKVVMLPCHGAEVVCYAVEVAPPDIALSDADKSILDQLANDMTLKDIAAAAGVSDGTVAAQCNRLREKCGVATNHGLIAFAARVGLLD